MNKNFYSQPAPELAKQLLGMMLVVHNEAQQCGGIIIETEAYTALDPASHSYRGETARNSAMFSAPGTLYVYRSYGIHYCLNIVCGNQDGQAVLIRAVLPTIGVELMQRNRNSAPHHRIANGPGNVFQALGLHPDINNIHIAKSPLQLKASKIPIQIHATPRIGISKATDVLWRYIAEFVE